MFSVAIAAGLVADAGLLAFVAVRGRRRWLQATYAACNLAFIVTGVAAVGSAEGLIQPARDDVLLGTMLLAHALTAILVLSLIHGETLARRRGAVFLLLVPALVLTLLAPSEGWTAATAYEASALGGFMVLCLGLALAETTYARLTSRLLAPHSFWLALGIVSLIVAGPVYTYELEFLRAPVFAGANVAAPIALACFALVALQSDPFLVSSRTRRGASRSGGLRPVDTLVFDETHPHYAVRIANEEAARGRSVLVIGRSPPSMPSGGTTHAAVVPSAHAALRTLTTASEFLVASPGGLIVLDDLAGLSVLSGWAPLLEAIVRIRHVARDTKSTALLSTNRLTEAERGSLANRGFAWWDLPDPAAEIEAILSQSFGPGAGRLLESFCRAHGIRETDLSTEHVPAFLAFVDRAFAELTGVVGGSAAHGLRAQSEAGASILREFAAQSPEELARGKWPSRRSGTSDADLLVTAADYWKGKETEELFAAAEEIGKCEPLFEKARLVFVEQLGDAGEGMLRSQLERIGKKPEELEKADLVRIADRASVDLGTLADVVDVPQERDRIQRQIESLRQRLELIVGEGE